MMATHNAQRTQLGTLLASDVLAERTGLATYNFSELNKRNIVAIMDNSTDVLKTLNRYNAGFIGKDGIFMEIRRVYEIVNNVTRPGDDPDDLRHPYMD